MALTLITRKLSYNNVLKLLELSDTGNTYTELLNHPSSGYYNELINNPLFKIRPINIVNKNKNK
jgi:hypothetical protein